MLRHVVSAFLLGIALAAGENLTKTDIPCAFDSDCHVGASGGGDEHAVKAVCVDNQCEFSLVVPPLKVVTTLGAECRVNEECNIADAICEEGECTCTNATVASFNKRRCLTEAKKIGDTCSEDIQCGFALTTCRSGTCICDAGYGPRADDETQCRQLKGIGNDCHTDDDCEIEHTVCNNSTCECTKGFSAHLKECYEISVGYLSKCDMDFQCQRVLGPDAICIRNVCHCQSKYIFSLLKNYCVRPNFGRSTASSFVFTASKFYLVPSIVLFLLAASM